MRQMNSHSSLYFTLEKPDLLTMDVLKFLISGSTLSRVPQMLEVIMEPRTEEPYWSWICVIRKK